MTSNHVDSSQQEPKTPPKSLYFSELLAHYMRLTAGLSVNEFVHTSLKFFREQMSICHCSIALVESNNTAFRLYDASHEDNTGLEAGDLLSAEMTILSEIIEHREPRYRPDIASGDSLYPIDKRLLAAGIQSDFLIPLWIENRCLGTLNLASDRVDGFCEEMRRFLPLLASSLAQSLQNIHLIESLQESEQRYRSLIDDMHDMIQSVGADGHFIYVNQAWLTLLGYHQQQLSELTLWDIIHPDCIEHCQDIFSRIMSGEDIHHIEATFCTKDGIAISVEGSISARRVGNQVVATQGIFRDIRKRKEVEKALRISENRFRTLVEQSPFSTQVLSPEGYTLKVNRAWKKMWGINGDILADFCILDDPQLVEKGVMPYIKKAFAGESAEIPDIVYNPAENLDAPGPENDRWVRSFIYPVKDEAGEIEEVILMHEDTTERIKAEKLTNTLDKISTICLQATDQEDLLSEVLNILLVDFKGDRVWLIHPCDPQAETWSIFAQAYNSKWPSIFTTKQEIVMDSSMAEVFSDALTSPILLDFHREDNNKEKTNPFFSAASQFHMALQTKIGKPWLLVLQYCEKTHALPKEEYQLLTEIGRRVSETLSSLLGIKNIKESQASLAEAQRIAHLGNWQFDHIAKKLTCSTEVYRIGGLHENNATRSYLSFLHTVHAHDRDIFHTSFLQSITNKTPFDITHRLQMKDGSIKHVHQYAETHYGYHDKPLRTIGTIQDVTSKILAEEKLRLAAAVVECTAEGIIITDAKSHVVSINKAFTNITGYNEHDMIGKVPSVLKSVRHSREFYNEMLSSIQKTGLWQGEIWLHHKTGKVFPAWSTVSAVYDDAAAISNYVSVFNDISSLKQSQERLDYLAYHDPLTSLPNRLLLNDRIDHALQHAHRENQQIAIFFIDLDRFKNVNDSLGHPVGDQLLKQVASRIKTMLREGDTLARLGGDEFVILLEDIASTKDLAILAKKVIDVFINPFFIIGHELQLTISLGVSLYPRDGLDSATLIKNADAAMYRAKEEGRNNYQFYTSALTSAVFERLMLESALRQALKNNELILHYQPQYSLITKKLIGAETLIRWQHPQMGLIYPEKFIPLAEETGLIYPIGEWVLQSACAQMQQWRRDGLPIETIAVNVSGYQCQRSEFIDTVKTALQLSQLAPKHLELEITESIIMQQLEKGVNILDELTRLGISIGIDDFGTGYSSLSYLRQLPIHKLKIDKSFINDITQNPNDAAITCAVIALGRSLQLTVLAEGVETQNQLDFLIQQGCHEAQGYLYSTPVPCDEFRKMLDLTPISNIPAP